ncbi:hypothetical protein MASR2M78_23380 [Treponema sp.]
MICPFAKRLLQGRFNQIPIMSDVAPSTTGIRSVDTLRSIALSEEVKPVRGSVLAPGANRATKVFQGGDAKDSAQPAPVSVQDCP